MPLSHFRTSDTGKMGLAVMSLLSPGGFIIVVNMKIVKNKWLFGRFQRVLRMSSESSFSNLESLIHSSIFKTAMVDRQSETIATVP